MSGNIALSQSATGLYMVAVSIWRVTKTYDSEDSTRSGSVSVQVVSLTNVNRYIWTKMGQKEREIHRETGKKTS